MKREQKGKRGKERERERERERENGEVQRYLIRSVKLRVFYLQGSEIFNENVDIIFEEAFQ